MRDLVGGAEKNDLGRIARQEIEVLGPADQASPAAQQRVDLSERPFRGFLGNHRRDEVHLRVTQDKGGELEPGIPADSDDRGAHFHDR